MTYPTISGSSAITSWPGETTGTCGARWTWHRGELKWKWRISGEDRPPVRHVADVTGKAQPARLHAGIPARRPGSPPARRKDGAQRGQIVSGLARRAGGGPVQFGLPWPELPRAHDGSP